MDSETLEKIALFTVSSELYYDLCDNLDTLDDSELLELIACNGDYEKELELSERIAR